MTAAKVHAGGLGNLTACGGYLLTRAEWTNVREDVTCLRCAKRIGLGRTDRDLAEEDHQYRDPRSGQIAPFSVTRIAKSFDDGDRIGAGAGAAVKLHRAGFDYRKVWDEKADLGTRIHAHMPRWAFGKPIDSLPDEDTRLDAFQAFTEAESPEWLHSERALISLLGYGGRFDLIGFIRGKWTLVDLKTGKPYEWENRLQLAAYCRADGMLIFDKDGNVTGIEDMPYIEAAGCLYLNENSDGEGVATWRDYLKTPAEIDEWFGHFTHLLDIHLAAQRVKAERKEHR